MENPTILSDIQIYYHYFKDFFDKHGMKFEIDPNTDIERCSIFVTLTPSSSKFYWPWFGFIDTNHKLSLGAVTVSLCDPDCLNKLEVNLPYFKGKTKERIKYEYEPFH